MIADVAFMYDKSSSSSSNNSRRFAEQMQHTRMPGFIHSPYSV